MRRLETVIFDIDGVIRNTSTFHFKAWGKLAIEIGIKLPWKFNEKLKGIGRIESLDLILLGNSELSGVLLLLPLF